MYKSFRNNCPEFPGLDTFCRSPFIVHAKEVKTIDCHGQKYMKKIMNVKVKMQ